MWMRPARTGSSTAVAGPLVIDFPQDYVAREMGDRLVTNPEFTEHQIVLGANLMHLEHVINLGAIDRDRVFLIGWPLRLPDADGGPASPVALSEWPGGEPRIVDLTLPVTEIRDGQGVDRARQGI